LDQILNLNQTLIYDKNVITKVLRHCVILFVLVYSGNDNK